MAKIGDVLEFNTVKGLAYAQITHRKPSYGPLLRVLEGTWEERPQDFDEVVHAPTRFHVFFPVGAAVRRKIISRVATVPVPQAAQQFPLLLNGGIRMPNGRRSDWWLWDGEEEWAIGPDLTEEQRRLSRAEIVNDTMLVEWIETDWHPGDEFD